MSGSPGAAAAAAEPGGARLLVVGAGLIGTSLALAARAAGYRVWLADRDSDRVAMAEALGAGARWPDGGRADLAVVATPPDAVPTTVIALARSQVAPVVTHVASVQAQPQAEIEARMDGFDGFVGSHPIAGRERSGPHHATADLFAQRPWIVCPAPSTGRTALDAVRALAEACGGQVSEMDAASHDRLFARLSHVPQLVASALAASLDGLDRPQAALAGAGLRDTSRLADSDPALWGGIVAANAALVAQALRRVVDPLAELLATLEDAEAAAADAAVRELLRRGRRGRDLLAGKHGQRAVRWGTVAVVVPDEPGRLARLLTDAAAAGVNVEDLRVDHSSGQPLGIVELDVAPEQADALEAELGRRGWSATASPPFAD